ncbi:membrane-associated protein, putative [Bodo saltans]|uniref:Membrane-associated protein, putative n=1 Tax=Bodo saltans TaxID=75058 RepID=A0A0S4IWS2_BODSA|nr:membrane-associated protein, putative [Bodo saltans]|eukprot:CUG05837.1 membrane-associated protein, putative [Bodo saltans]
MSSVYLQCVGALSLLSGALAFRMSLFRLAGSPGEDKPNSPINNWGLTQCLAAEWNPLVIGLLLALHLRGDNSTVSVATAVALTASRIVFAGRTVAPKALAYPVSFGSMVTSYLGVFLLSGKLLLEL